MRKLILMLAMILSVQIAQAMTLSDIRTEIRLRTHDVNSSRYRYTDAQLKNLINEAQRDVNNGTWVTAKSTTTALVSGTTYYDLPTDIVAVLRVTRDYKLLSETTIDALDAKFIGGAWENSGGAPNSYFQDMSRPGQIGLYPFPNSAANAGNMRIIYIAQPTDLSSDSDEPFNSEERFRPYHDLLVFFSCYRILMTDGSDKDNVKATSYRQEYENRLELMRQLVGRKPNYNPGLTGGVK